MAKHTVLMAHTSHLDLFWFAGQPECLEIGRQIIEDAVNYCKNDKNFHFVIESVRFAEYFVLKNPEMVDDLKKFIAEGRIEVSATYSDRHEFFHHGETYVRNVTYGRRLLKKLLDCDSRFSFHPDLPGFSEQTPQIHKKAGLDVYFQARGYATGTRIRWAGLDGSTIVYYNFPGGYGGADVVHFVYPNMEKIQKDLGMKEPMLCMGASDCGKAGTSHSRINGEERGRRHELKDIIDFAQRTVDVECKMVSPCATVLAQDNSNIPIMQGEAPNRWGCNGSPTNTITFQRDKIVSALLCDGEKLFAIMKNLGVDVTDRAREGYHTALGHFTAWRRRYFDKYLFEGDKKNTATVNDWFDFSWRMIMTTHDHNYGGSEGAQSEFDRYMYQDTAEKIALRTIAAALGELSKKVSAKKDSVLVFNTLNWEREDFIEVNKNSIEPGKRYAARDNNGKTVPVVLQNGKNIFRAEGIPSIGYKTYEIVETEAVPAQRASSVRYGGTKIIMENKYYSLTVDTITGFLENITDYETGLELNGDFLHIRVYEDLANSVNEKVHEWNLIEDVSENTYSVKITSDNAYMTVLTVKAEILKAHLEIDIELYHHEKRFDIRPRISCPGFRRAKVCMTLPHSPELANRYYGVPYGAQKFGNWFTDPAEYKPGGDEISEILYRRYREIHLWMAAEDGKRGFSFATIHGAMIWKPESNEAVLMRCVASIDSSFHYDNDGQQSWYFSFCSYNGSWESNMVWRRAWELLHPARTAALENDGDASLPSQNSFIGTDGVGIATVYKVSDADPDAYTLRVFNPCSVVSQLKITGSIGKDAKWECRNLDETACPDPVDKLGAYEIKTLIKK